MNVLAIYTWQGFLNAHKFYMKGPKNNKQTQKMLAAIEKELVFRALLSTSDPRIKDDRQP